LAFGVYKSNSKRRRRVIGLRLHFLSTSSLLLVVARVDATEAVVVVRVDIGRLFQPVVAVQAQKIKRKFFLAPITR
jgi:hypothetical protein